MADTVSTGFNPTITPQQVYSAENIAYTPTPIDYSDPYKLRDYFLNTPDLVASRNAVAEANKLLTASKQSARDRQLAIKNTPFAMNVMRGWQGVATDEANADLASKSENLLAAQSTYDTFANEANARYGIAQQEREKLQSLITQTGGKAGISYADTFENALAKATSYQEKLTKDAEKKAKKEAEDKYKQSLKAAAMELGISTKTKKGGSMSVKDLEKAITASKKIDKDKLNQLNDLKLQAERASIAKSLKPDNLTQSEQLQSDVQESYGYLDSKKGKDGYVDPLQYNYAKQKWSKFNAPSKFDEYFQGYVNPNDYGRVNFTKTSAQLLKSE